MKALGSHWVFFIGLVLCCFQVSAQPQWVNGQGTGQSRASGPPDGSGQQEGRGQMSNRESVEPADPLARAKVHTELAASYFEIGNMAVALDELRIALDAESDYAPAYSVRGLVHASLREFDKAEEQFRKALNLTPNDPEVNNNYGWFLCHTGKERQSIAYFLNALKSPLYKTPDRAYANAGRCALKAGDFEGAEQYLSQAIKMSQDGALMARFQMAELNYRRGNLQLARHTIGPVLQSMGVPSADVVWLALRIERKMGNRVEEGSLAAQLRNRYPDSPEYQAFLKGDFE